MKATGPPIKNPESIDLPSSLKKGNSQPGVPLPRPHTLDGQNKLHQSQGWGNKRGLVVTVLTWILVVIVAVTLHNFVYMVGNEAPPKEIVRKSEVRRVVQPTPTYSVQSMILASKILLQGQLREKGMLIGECGTFRCSKRWNDYMDAEIIRLFGR